MPKNGTYADRLKFWRQKFKSQNIETAGLDARLLLQFTARLDAAQLITCDIKPIPVPIAEKFDAACTRRLNGEPIARIIGEKEFFGRSFILNYDTLIPRPETELLVELALKKLPPKGNFLDLGTGSGAILVSILAERLDSHGIGTDINANALSCAQKNAEKLAVAQRAQFLLSDWFQAIPAQKFDLIVSNPPYIGHDETNEMNDESLHHDPARALFAKENGLAAYKRICKDIAQFLKPEGWLLVEIGHRQAPAVSGLMVQAGLSHIAVHQDLAGLDRVVAGKLLLTG